MSNKPYHIVEKNDYPRLFIKKRYPYKEILKLLLEGHEIFIETNRKTAYYIKRELEKRVNLKIDSYPAEYKKMKGYVFKISLIHQLLEKFEKNEEN